MTETSSRQEELRALRLAAEQGDWNGCRSASERLLSRLPVELAVRLTRDHVMRRLPVFERHHPGVRWPREFIESMDDSGASPSEREWPEAEDDFSGPGANSFTSAVEALWRAGRLIEHVQRCVPELVNALSESIMAEKGEFWGSRNPQAWALWYRLTASGDNDPRIVDIQLAMKRDPQAAAVQRDSWLEVSDWLEAALR
ncbi:hypothetical protein [Hyalangium rubrum]|uniref:Uncharacterized protein n=1 Tax=Hyalangium rubrum TaxID=3103134 RepID=A0ABU5H3C3_9BACT|nr:hypothetical protein [Hyalangium sp. s54d21]MDY7227277.1 hypothetical protein [Hyalangium sp. s54d21]